VIAIRSVIGASIDPRSRALTRRSAGRALRFAARARKLMWKSLLKVTGGISSRGASPAGGSVIVANHSSHADTAALLAVLPAGSCPVVVAAADYWFATRGRAWLCRSLVGGVPVRRHGGGRADLMRLADLARSGRTVVLFPEGTRSRTGDVGEFHTGAIHLARAAGVPLVPVGILGTRHLLAPGGLPHFANVEVRIGEALHEASPAAVRDAVAALIADSPVGVPDSSLRRRVGSLAMSRKGLAVVALWGCAEALALPIVTELVVGLAVLAAPRAWWRLALAGAAGATVGAALGWSLAAGGVVVPAPLTTPRMHAIVAAQVADEEAAALVHQPFSGIPFKVYVAELGGAHAPAARVLAYALPLRLARLATFALIAALIGLAGRRVRHLYPAAVLFILATFAVGLHDVVRSWQ
jgi:1-acyl-sn-glycerol-3-phosphate acyltransferase